MGWDELSLRDLCRNQPCSHIDFRFLNQVLLFWATQFVAIGYNNPRKRIHLHTYSVNCSVLSIRRASGQERKALCFFPFPRENSLCSPGRDSALIGLDFPWKSFLKSLVLMLQVLFLSLSSLLRLLFHLRPWPFDDCELSLPDVKKGRPDARTGDDSDKLRRLFVKDGYP